MFDKHIREECNRVQKLTGEVNSMWVECGRPQDKLWANDAISQIKGADGEKGETLVLAGITSVA